MMIWAGIFLLVALTAGLVGFGGAVASAGIAQLAFFLFLALAVLAVVLRMKDHSS